MMAIPAASQRYQAEEVDCVQILDPIVGLLTPQQNAREGRFKNDHLIDTPMESCTSQNAVWPRLSAAWIDSMVSSGVLVWT